MIKYQKKVLLAEASEPLFIRHQATESHNEITVVIVTYTLPLSNILPEGSMNLSPSIIKAALEVNKIYPNINLEFNKNPNAPALLFRVKGKTQRRGDDVHNQQLADKIALSKANDKAYAIASRLISRIKAHLFKTINALDIAREVFDYYEYREYTYLNKVNRIEK